MVNPRVPQKNLEILERLADAVKKFVDFAAVDRRFHHNVFHEQLRIILFGGRICGEERATRVLLQRPVVGALGVHGFGSRRKHGGLIRKRNVSQLLSPRFELAPRSAQPSRCKP